MRAHLAWGLALVAGLVLQTSLFPFLVPAPWAPDVTRGLVLWVALTGLPRGGPLLAAGAGLALDVASGAPLGFGMFLRLLLYGVARPFRGVFFDDRPILLFPFVILGPWVDAAAAALAAWVTFPAPLDASVLTAIAGRQAVVDAVWVPFLFIGLELACGRRAGREIPA